MDSNEPFKEYDFRDPFGNKHTISFEDEKNARPFQPYEVQVINDFWESHNYWVKVQAVNNEGVALVEPQIVEGRTGEGVPSSIPADFRLLTQVIYTILRTLHSNIIGRNICYFHLVTR